MFTSVSAKGFDFTCGLHQDGTIACWGRAQIAPGGTFVDFSLAEHFACVLDSAGEARCWGDTSSTTIENVPLFSFLSLAAGTDRVCGITMNDDVVCWGSNAASAIPP